MLLFGGGVWLLLFCVVLSVWVCVRCCDGVLLCTCFLFAVCVFIACFMCLLFRVLLLFLCGLLDCCVRECFCSCWLCGCLLFAVVVVLGEGLV